jgi:hypothetical protein
MAIHVAAHGATCAAWLVWQFRGVIHRAGAFLVHLPRRAEPPPWFRVALAHLQGRRGWLVVEERGNFAHRYWRVTWTAWSRWSKRAAQVAAITRVT